MKASARVFGTCHHDFSERFFRSRVDDVVPMRILAILLLSFNGSAMILPASPDPRAIFFLQLWLRAFYLFCNFCHPFHSVLPSFYFRQMTSRALTAWCGEVHFALHRFRHWLVRIVRFQLRNAGASSCGRFPSTQKQSPQISRVREKVEPCGAVARLGLRETHQPKQCAALSNWI